MKVRHVLVFAMAAAAIAAPFDTLAEDTSVTRQARSAALKLPIEGAFPSLAGATTWLNSPPLTPADLRGKVVLLDVWTYTCINWLRTLPYVRAWADKYKDMGLVVIGVHSPEFPFEHDVDNVRRAATEMRVAYPIAIDNDFAIWRALKNQYWPALYVVDAQGRIRHHQFGEGGYEQSERIIQQLLLEAGNSGIGRDLATVDAPGLEAPAAWNDLKSPENYVGYERTENFASSGGTLRDTPRVYSVPGRLPLNHWALSGDWTMNKGAGDIEQGEWAHCVSLSRPRPSSRDGAGNRRWPGPFPRAHRWQGAGPRARSGRRRPGSRNGHHPAAVSAGPAIPAHRRQDIRDRISRSRRRSVCLHFRMILDPARFARAVVNPASRRLAGTSTLIRVVMAALTSVLLSACGSLPMLPERPTSASLPPGNDSPLVRSFQHSTPNPAMTGFLLMPVGFLVAGRQSRACAPRRALARRAVLPHCKRSHRPLVHAESP